MKEEVIMEIDLRHPPERMSVGFRMVLLKMALEVKLRESFGATDDELRTHEELVELCYDKKYADGVVDDGSVGTIEDIDNLLYLSIFEQLFIEHGVSPSMFCADCEEIKSVHFNRMPKSPMEMLEFLYIPEDEMRMFENQVGHFECN